jgi:hypothetical protein
MRARLAAAIVSACLLLPIVQEARAAKPRIAGRDRAERPIRISPVGKLAFPKGVHNLKPEP